ncbi:DUF423 domain-containing protein [Methylacidiphilum kamchatkense]|uniref:DUF423 domain-containing protein n=1 Tax=Methylacidiphilum kamchatkense TaxID=431057 RepID=UPI00068DA9D0|nr:DUF423 domain-containing protein [Methylacidiphilum kamchatkense]
MNNIKMALPAFLGGLAVIMGAYGAHGLKPAAQESHFIEMWKTAVQYHFIHVLALLFIGNQRKGFWIPFFLFFLGIVFFSGSLYILVLSKSFYWAKFTPIGGGCFIFGWVWLGFEALFKRNISA